MNKVMSATGSVIIASALSVATPVQAQTSVADFYSGKTVNLIIGFGAGGGYDTYGRVLAQHMGKHIPGNPTVVPQNMPGAGSIVASNFLYNTAPKDGTTMGMVAASALMQPLFGSSQVKFDSSKFGWLGSMDQSIAFCGVAVASGVESFQDWLKSGKQLALGASGPAANTFQHPMALRNVLDVNAKVVPGYKGTADVAVAMENGEMDGLCGMQVTSIRSSFQSLIDRGVMRLIIQMGPERTSEFGALPSVYDFVENEDEKRVMDLVFGQLKLARPVAVPPGIPSERLKALQDAFLATLQDPEFLAAAEQAGMEINLVKANDVQALLVDFASFSPRVIELAGKAVAPDK